jgi:hypothetical protein
MKLRSISLAAAAATLVITGCGSDSTAPNGVDHLGRYGLVSVDGTTLPIALFDTPTLKLTLASGAWTLNADSTFVEEVRIEVVANGFPAPPELGVCSGTYHRDGNSFAMTAAASETCVGGSSTATSDGRTFTAAVGGSTLVFRR